MNPAATRILLTMFACVCASAPLKAASTPVPFSEEAAYRAAYLGDTANLARWIDEKGGLRSDEVDELSIWNL